MPSWIRDDACAVAVVNGAVSTNSWLALRGVTQRFGASWVLHGITTDFESHAVTVIEGANGAGKSTLLSVAGGLLKPTGGVVLFMPDAVGVDGRREDLGWVGHDSACYRELTARENVEFAAELQLGDCAGVTAALARVGADAFENKPVAALSRGQKQRVALARAIVHGPSLLLLDEPFTGLDEGGTRMLEAVLLEEAARGAIVLVVSHDRTLAPRLGARVLRLVRGRVESPG